MERVSVIQGKSPVILVCPHGPDDTFTEQITEMAANLGGFYAVINRGFERANKVDIDDDKADCNRVDHVLEPVIDDEFLQPILKYKSECLSSFGQAFIFHIHGFGDQVEKDAGYRIDLILGYGESDKKPSYSCELWHRNVFIHLWRTSPRGGDICVGAAGGKYAARDSNNLNQFFRKHVIDQDVYSMQLEISRRIRRHSTDADNTALAIARAIAALLTNNEQSALAVTVPKFTAI